MGLLAAFASLFGAAQAAPASTSASGLTKVREQFIVDPPPTPSSHASTIEDTPGGLVASWFGGTAEKEKDVCIWVARQQDGKWLPPVKVADGIEPDDGQLYPTWNPVLFQPKQGPLLLFYKIGPSPDHWWGRYLTSDDHGRTWSKSKRLAAELIGPVRNKPVQLRDGTILCGASTEDAGWRVHMERLQLPAWHWERTPALNEATEWGAIQPTILPWSDKRIQILCRSRQAAILESWSEDGGRTWSQLSKISLPNPNSGIDAVLLKDGRALLVHNNIPKGRGQLGVALSRDGKRWEQALELENSTGEYSYPAVIQSADGLVHITYTWRRLKVKHVVVSVK